MDYDDVIRDAAKAMVAVSSDDPPRWEDAPPSIIATLETAMRAAAPILMEYGRALERAAIVEWLRDNAMGERWRQLANAIEAGEHLSDNAEAVARGE